MTIPEIETRRASVDVDGSPMSVFMARPKGGVRRPGLLLFQEAFGVNAHIRDVAQRFAREGYVVAAPELYHRTAPGHEGSYTDAAPSLEHMKKMTPEGQQADFRAAQALLCAEAGVDAENVSAAGFCMGGRAAFLAAATLPLRAAVSYYGGGIAALLGHAAALSCPLLMHWGGQDAHIPPQQIASVTAELRRLGKPYVNAEYSFAGHGFNCDQRASFHPAAAAQAWALTLRFLAEPAA